MTQTAHTGRQRKLLFALLSGIILTALSLTAVAQTQPADQPAPQASVKVETLAAAATAPVLADYVSIHVDGGTLRQVLNAFSMQTQRNVVIGPEVTAEGVSIHLNNVRWDEALDVILKPYGFGYRKVGGTVVVSKLDKLASLAAVEPLETKVFSLKYLDASDVQEIIKGQLSPRGSISIASARGQKGWQFASAAAGGNRGSSSGTTLGKLTRTGDQDQVKSKTLLVTDVPGSLARVAEVLAEVDKVQQQVQVEARFMEVNEDLTRNVGLDFTKATFGLTISNISFHGGSAGDDTKMVSLATMNATAAINLLMQDGDTKVLSAPRILTLNNQEATIIVGQKYPIIRSDVTGGNSSSASSTLDYYENIGIMLNVVPQICAGGFINMIVHPTVSSISGFASAKTGGDLTSLTEYPIINTREAETQIMLKNDETIVIGGLLEERKKAGVQKVPVLGSIPLIGRLFRNETTDKQTIDLLIFLSANVVGEDNYDRIIAKEGQAEMSGKPAAVKEKPAPEVPVMGESQKGPSSEAPAGTPVHDIYNTLQGSSAVPEAEVAPAGTM